MHFNWLLYNLQAARFVCHIHTQDTSKAHIMHMDSWIHGLKYEHTLRATIATATATTATIPLLYIFA